MHTEIHPLIIIPLCKLPFATLLDTPGLKIYMSMWVYVVESICPNACVWETLVDTTESAVIAVLISIKM